MTAERTMDERTMSGPCIICGGRDYPLSCGGPTICPKCDCGHFDAATVEKQARVIADLTVQLARCREDTVEECAKWHDEKLADYKKQTADARKWPVENNDGDPHLAGTLFEYDLPLLIKEHRLAAKSIRALAPTTGDGR